MQPTNSTKEKAEGVKAYIESKYAKAKNEEKEKKEGTIRPLFTSLFIAWDKLNLQMDKMQLSETEKELIKQEIQHKESELYRMQ